MMAIETKYLPATNYKGSRIKATLGDVTPRSVTISYPDELSGADCHWAAAEKLIRKLGWAATYGEPITFIAGGTRLGYVFVVSAIGGRSIEHQTFTVEASK